MLGAFTHGLGVLGVVPHPGLFRLWISGIRRRSLERRQQVPLQARQGKGLAQDVADAAPLRVGHYGFGGMARHQDAAGAVVGGANRVEHLESIHVRQVKIEQDQFGEELVGGNHGQLAVAGNACIPAATLEVRLQVRREHFFILDDEDLLGLGHGCSCLILMKPDRIHARCCQPRGGPTDAAYSTNSAGCVPQVLVNAADRSGRPKQRPEPGTGQAAPKRAANLARALTASTSRLRGSAVVTRESMRTRAEAATSSTAFSNAASLALDGTLKPLSFRTNWSEASRISTSVAGGSKLNNVLMFRHMAIFKRISENLPSERATAARVVPARPSRSWAPPRAMRGSAAVHWPLPVAAPRWSTHRRK